MSSILSRAVNYLCPLFGVGYMSTFFMRNEIIFEDIKKCQNILLFTFLIYTALISGVTKGLSQGGKCR